MNVRAHWQAFYNTMRTGLDNAGRGTVPIRSVHTGLGADNQPTPPPLVVYEQAPGRTVGTPAGGNLQVLSDTWHIVSRATGLADALDILTIIIGDLTDQPIATTDGYQTTALRSFGVQSLYETDAELYAAHTWFQWERSRQ